MMAFRSKRRPGIAMIEMTVAIMVLAAGMVVTLRVVGWVALDRRSVERREKAVMAASNLLERAASRPWDETTTEALTVALPLPQATAEALPGSALAWDVRDDPGPVAGRRVTLEVRWLDRAGRSEAPVRLVAWVYRKEAAR